MENNKNKMLIIAVAVIFVLTTIGVTYFIRTRNFDSPNPDIGTIPDEEKDQTTTTKLSKKDIVQGKKFVTMNTDSYIDFPSKGVFNKYSAKPDGSHTTDSGKYSVNNKRITLDKLKTDAYYKEDYILLKDGLYNEDIYTMYYESSKNADFVKKLGALLPEYIEKSVENTDELKELILKIEVDEIDYCFKVSKDESEFSCSVNYRVYLKDYDSKKENEYDGLFAGSSPTYKKDYVLRWSFFNFKENDNYKVTASFTGM